MLPPKGLSQGTVLPLTPSCGAPQILRSLGSVLTGLPRTTAARPPAAAARLSRGLLRKLWKAEPRPLGFPLPAAAAASCDGPEAGSTPSTTLGWLLSNSCSSEPPAAAAATAVALAGDSLRPRLRPPDPAAATAAAGGGIFSSPPAAADAGSELMKSESASCCLRLLRPFLALSAAAAASVAASAVTSSSAAAAAAAAPAAAVLFCRSSCFLVGGAPAATSFLQHKWKVHSCRE